MSRSLPGRAIAMVTAGFLVAHGAPSSAVTGGVSVDEVLAAPASYSQQQAAYARSVAAVTVPLIRFDAAGTPVGLCTSTIVHPRVVLTAAHCVLDGREASRHLTAYFQHGASRLQALDTVVHPDFLKLVQSRLYRPETESLSAFIKRTQHPSVSGDLALVLLHRQVPDTYDVVAPVSAGFRDERTTTKLIAGYGRTDGYRSIAELALYFAELKGNTRLDEGSFIGRDDIILESRYRNGTRVNTCKGDSGGPILALERGESRLRQVAVTSAGDTHCREFAMFAPINGQRTMLRQMFNALMQGEQGAQRNPF